ncbi:hypothetical protein SO802_029069 [Lithocarpus litseifolius]|uniref:Uncharacterized protein n=1 Tax=Lithocarpus litseifolius TaxID=425828 RepID=A0AAW2BXQ5_9ROSI
MLDWSWNKSKITNTVEEVSFAANGITAEGIKAFDGVLQSNIVLKTLDLSGNPIGDEGIKDVWSENDEEIDRAIAESLLEESQRGKRVIGA